MTVRGVDVAAGVGVGVGVGVLGVGLVLALTYVAVRPRLPSIAERAVVAELANYRNVVDRTNPLAGVVADAVGAEQVAALVGRVVRRLVDENLP